MSMHITQERFKEHKTRSESLFSIKTILKEACLFVLENK